MKTLLVLSIFINVVLVLVILILFSQQIYYKNKKELEIKKLTDENFNLIEKIYIIINGE